MRVASSGSTGHRTAPGSLSVPRTTTWRPATAHGLRTCSSPPSEPQPRGMAPAALPIDSSLMNNPRIPDRPSVDGLDGKWAAQWHDQRLYAFDRTRTRDEVYSIDPPPPTVSGSWHVGHVFSYTHTDCIARDKRMQGLEVFYPMGWDDNGLPTERRVQN